MDHWNGYYSTRAHFKSEIRDLFGSLRNSKKLFSTLKLNLNGLSVKRDVSDIHRNLTLATQLSSVLLHHDAITGTHSLKVKKDYQERLE